MNNDFFTDFYYTVLENIFNNVNIDSNILIITKNKLDLSNDFDYIIKKKNIKIDILINNNNNDDVMNENISIYNEINNLTNIYTTIIIFYLETNDDLSNMLNNLHKFISKETFIYIYCCISNMNENKIYYKNIFRNLFIEKTNYNIGSIINFKDFIYIVKKNNYTIQLMNIYIKNIYIFYGKNNIYKIILKKYS
jgi:hypothetical protein